MTLLQNFAPANIPVWIVGNKVDLMVIKSDKNSSSNHEEVKSNMNNNRKSS